MSSTLDIEAIRDRTEDLASIEKNLRLGREQTGETRWPFGDMIRASLADAKNLAARVEELEAALAKREPEADPLRSALIGILRAEGHVIHLPATYTTSEVYEPPAFDPDAVASDMLGEDEPHRNDPDGIDDYGPKDTTAESSPRGACVITRTPVVVCPHCDQPLPPDGRCQSAYVNCQRSAPAVEQPAAPLAPGESVRITSDGPWLGRYAIVENHEQGKPPAVCVIAKGAELADAIGVAHVLVVNPDVDEPTRAESPAAKSGRTRAPEPPKLVTEWAPDGRDFEGYAKDLGCDAARVQSLVASFKDWASKSEPEQRRARWGGTFKEWAKARLANQA